MEEKYIDTKNLCEWLDISSSTASRWRQEGMPYYGRGKSLRYYKSEIEKWLTDQREKEKKK